MTSHENSKEESKTVPPASDSESDFELEEDSEDDAEGVDEETAERWISTTYYRDLENPMKEPLKESWDLPVSDADVEKIKVGFKSFSMDFKWDLKVESPDENGNISLHIIRNWHREDCYVLHIAPKPSSDDNASAKIIEITWEGDKSGLQCSEEQAKIEAILLSRRWLQCEFEKLPHYPAEMLWASSGYKRVHSPPPPRTSRKRRPAGKHGRLSRL